MAELDGKAALVTGGSRGLGEFMAEALVRAGATVYVSSRKAAACEETANRLSAFGTCVSLPADLSSQAELGALAAEVARQQRVARPERHPASGAQLGKDLPVRQRLPRQTG